MTVELQPDGRKFGRIKIGGMRAKDVVAYVYTTFNFGFKGRIETVGENRIEIAISSPRNLSFG